MPTSGCTHYVDRMFGSVLLTMVVVRRVSVRSQEKLACHVTRCCGSALSRCFAEYCIRVGSRFPLRERAATGENKSKKKFALVLDLFLVFAYMLLGLTAL